MTIYLVCEGPADGLDVRVLDLVIAQKLELAVQIIPVGGDSSLKSVRRWLEERSRRQLPDGRLTPPYDYAYAIEDRNFRSSIDVEKSWQNSKQSWIWHRHEIENYLLDPRLITEAFQTLKTTPVAQSFAAQLPDTEQKALTLLQQLAHLMLEDYAGQLTCKQLSFYKGDTANTNIGCRLPNFISNTSSPYPNQNDWLTYLQDESQRLKQVCQQVFNDTSFNLPSIESRYKSILTEVNSPEFLDGQFLADMGGHELMRALFTHIKRDVGLTRLTYTDFVDELIRALDKLYSPGFFDPDDFTELANNLTKINS